MVLFGVDVFVSVFLLVLFEFLLVLLRILYCMLFQYFLKVSFRCCACIHFVV